MSGGSFDYAYSRVNYFVDDLDDKLNEPDEEFSPEVMTKLREIKGIAATTAQLMRAVEWLYSGDDSEECFLRKIGDQQSEIVSLYEMNLAQAKTIKAYQDLCDQLGNAVEETETFWPPSAITAKEYIASQDFLTKRAREILDTLKGERDGDTKHRTGG